MIEIALWLIAAALPTVAAALIALSKTKRFRREVEAQREYAEMTTEEIQVRRLRDRYVAGEISQDEFVLEVDKVYNPIYQARKRSLERQRAMIPNATYLVPGASTYVETFDTDQIMGGFSRVMGIGRKASTGITLSAVPGLPVENCHCQECANERLVQELAPPIPVDEELSPFPEPVMEELPKGMPF